jgi:hypothetical protein
MPRSIILHHHIFKNAGSTLDAALRRQFGCGFAEFHPNASDSGRVSPEELKYFVDQHWRLWAISSHHFMGRDFKSSLPEKRDEYQFFDFVLLRHPVSRLASIYLYYRGLPKEDHPLHMASHDQSFSEFLEFIISSYPNFVINPQVTMFGCDHYGVVPSNKNIDRAMARLMDVSCLGVVEEYASAMVIAEYFLQPVFPDLQLHGKIANTSRRSPIAGYDGSLESIQAAIGDVLFKKVCALNDLDIALWSMVSSEVERRKKYVPDFSLRLQDYSLRCASI